MPFKAVWVRLPLILLIRLKLRLRDRLGLAALRSEVLYRLLLLKLPLLQSLLLLVVPVPLLRLVRLQGFVFGNTFVPNADDTDEGAIEQVDANADGDEKEDDVEEQDVMAADDVDFAIGVGNEQNARFADELVASEHKVSTYEQEVNYVAQEHNQAESDDELEMFGNDEPKYHQWLRSDEATRISGGKYATLIGYVIKVTPKMVRVSIVGIDDCEVYVHRRHIEPGYCGCFDEEEVKDVQVKSRRSERIRKMTAQADVEAVEAPVLRRSVRLAART